MTNKYKPGDIITHYKGNEYVILMTPAAGLALESDGAPAYMYSNITNRGVVDGKKWLRRQDEVEDVEKFQLSKSVMISDAFRKSILKLSIKSH